MASDTGRKRGPYAPTLVRRREISTAALALVDDVGPESVTTALVAERSGISEATVLYHYPSRDDLMVAALTRSDEIIAESVNVDDPSIALDLDDFAAAYETPSLDDPRHRLQLIVRGLSATPGTAAAEFFQRRTERQVSIFARLFDQRKRDGLAHPAIESVEVARQVIALREGLGIVFASDPDVDTRRLLLNAIRRLSGENWMQLRRVIDGRETF